MVESKWKICRCNSSKNRTNASLGLLSPFGLDCYATEALLFGRHVALYLQHTTGAPVLKTESTEQTWKPKWLRKSSRYQYMAVVPRGVCTHTTISDPKFSNALTTKFTSQPPKIETRERLRSHSRHRMLSANVKSEGPHPHHPSPKKPTLKHPTREKQWRDKWAASRHPLCWRVRCAGLLYNCRLLSSFVPAGRHWRPPGAVEATTSQASPPRWQGPPLCKQPMRLKLKPDQMPGREHND